MPSLDPLLDAVQQVVQSVPASGIDSLCDALRNHPDVKTNSQVLVQSVTLPNHRTAVINLFARWQKNFADVAPESLALAIRTAAYCHQKHFGSASEALIWTGPPVPGLHVRRIDQALLEVIDTAQKELLLVTFAAYKVPIIIEALTSALQRGVTIRFVAETVESSQGKVSFDATKFLGPELAPKIQVFVWPLAKRTVEAAGKHGSLHAKCAVADRRMLLMSSANLTGYALDLNIEMRVLVTGGNLPGRVVDVFTYLIRNQTLSPE